MGFIESSAQVQSGGWSPRLVDGFEQCNPMVEVVQSAERS